jgi:uncharacterized membrane protein
LTIRNEFLIIAACGAVLLVLIATGGPALVRLALGLAFVLFVPGYALQTALFPRDEDLDGPERWALSFGLSIAVISLLALLLDRLPWGLRLWPIVVGEGLVVAAASGAALWLRGRLPPEERFRLELEVDVKGWWSAQDRFNRILYSVLAVAAVVALGASLSILVLPNPGDFFTEFYILGPDGLAESYPREVVVGEPVTVTMGIRSLERGTMAYRVEIWGVDPLQGREALVAEPGEFVLGSDETVETEITWAMLWAGADQQVQFRLYSEPQGTEPVEPYRSLRLWLNVKEREGE